jgi:hypothetical protein
MIRKTKDCRNIKSNIKAASPAISMVIITAATVVLVLVSSIFALQALEHQQAAAEFDTVQKSVVAFDDAVRDIAWDLGGSRSVRFTTNYGNMRLIASNKAFQIDGPSFTRSFNTSLIQYQIPNSYLNLGRGYHSYILGDENTVISSLTESLAQVSINQEKNFYSLALNYRVRVSQEGPSTIVNGQFLTYVDILIIRLNSTGVTLASGDFDLTAKNIAITTETFGPTSVGAGDRITVNSGGVESYVHLDAGNYMFNLILSDVQVRP